jgi:hypothetical protein
VLLLGQLTSQFPQLAKEFVVLGRQPLGLARHLPKDLLLALEHRDAQRRHL